MDTTKRKEELFLRTATKRLQNITHILTSLSTEIAHLTAQLSLLAQLRANTLEETDKQEGK